MPRPRPPFLHREESRHGRVMWFVRRKHGARIRLRAEYGSEAFWAEYRAALEGAPLPSKEPKAQTLAWALDLYRASSSWGKLATSTRRQRENIYRAAIKSAGDVSLKSITDKTIKAGRERRKATPHRQISFWKRCALFSRGRLKISSSPSTQPKALNCFRVQMTQTVFILGRRR